jgi:hypothetical protein
MSYDRYSDEYYLTTDGWKTEASAFLPDSHIETWEKHVVQTSGYGPEDWTWHKIWSNPNFTDEQIALANEKFPRPSKPTITPEMAAELFKNFKA